MKDIFKKTLYFLEKMSREYYKKRRPWVPNDFMLREFAIQTWRSKSYIRHLSFQSIEEISKILVTKAPRHFYYSSARYNQPEATDMDMKGWRSSDLVFDIDADHLPECKDKVIELNVEEVGEKVSLIDDKCIEYAALRALILKDILVYELGIEEKRITLEFSGNRGFHVTAYLDDNDELAKSPSDVRREIVNYIKAVDLSEDTLKPWTRINVRRGHPSPILPSPYSGGARGRLARIMILIAKRRGLKTFLAKLYNYQATNVVYDEEARQVEEEARHFLGVEIDEQVTIDTSRLIRAPWSLNGKTMLPVIPLKEYQLLEFKLSFSISPFTNEDPVRIRLLTDIPPAIKILGTKLSLRRNDKPKLEAPLAFYLLSKGLAILE